MTMTVKVLSKIRTMASKMSVVVVVMMMIMIMSSSSFSSSFTTSRSFSTVESFVVVTQNRYSTNGRTSSSSASTSSSSTSLFSSLWGLEEDPMEQSSTTTGSSSSPSPPNIDSSPGGALTSPLTSDEVWQTLQPIKVQGGSLRTWSFATPSIQSIQVQLRTEGRPMNANVELWQGPDNTPQKVAVYLEDGSVRPFRCTMLTPHTQNAIAIRNTAQMEYPLHAGVQADMSPPSSSSSDDEESGTSVEERLATIPCPRIIQGGAVFTMPFNPSVASVEILLKTDGRPLNARIELLQGPNNVKQVMEVYTEDGAVRPFYVIVDTPGTGNVIRIVNTATIEFPINASVEPFSVVETYDPDENYFITSTPTNP